jgi:hypothetical protein
MHALYAEFRKPWSIDHISLGLFGLGGLGLLALVFRVSVDLMRAL